MFDHLGTGIVGHFDLIAIAHLDEHQIAKILDNLASQSASIGTTIEGAVDFVETSSGFVVDNGLDETDDRVAGGRAKDGLG